MNNVHKPVLLKPILNFFQQEINNLANSVVFDGTFGGGSYSKDFLELGAQVWATDLDPAAKEIAGSIKSDKLHFIQTNFADQIQDFQDNFLDLAVLDLGFSSNQLEIGKLGFSYLQTDQIFDLRFNPEEGKPAFQYICEQTVDKLGRTIYQYSGESMARRIAASIIETSKEGKYTNLDITEAILKVIPDKLKHKRFSIFSRVWQALRIAVNKEFESLETFLTVSPSKVKVGGLIAIVCFHSLEDKMVTKKFRDLARPVEIDSFGNKEQNWKLLTSHPIIPDETELDENNRARSATLRVIKKLK
jgi:16S rRNA (cytosine1402-N4)-methyltransferase